MKDPKKGKANPWQPEGKYPVSVNLEEHLMQVVHDVQAKYKFRSKSDAIRKIIDDYKKQGDK